MALRDYLQSQWIGKANVEGTVDALDASASRVVTDVDARVLELLVDTATEDELDEYLSLVGPNRTQIDATIRANTSNAADLTLALYRRIAKGAGAAARSSGAIEDLYAVWVAIEPDLDAEITTPFTAGAVAFDTESIPTSGDADVDESYEAVIDLVLNGAAPLGVVVTLTTGAI
jgi:hypothetical protein